MPWLVWEPSRRLLLLCGVGSVRVWLLLVLPHVPTDAVAARSWVLTGCVAAGAGCLVAVHPLLLHLLPHGRQLLPVIKEGQESRLGVCMYAALQVCTHSHT